MGVESNQWVRAIICPCPPHLFLCHYLDTTLSYRSGWHQPEPCENALLLKMEQKKNRTHQNSLHRERINITSWNFCFHSESGWTTLQCNTWILHSWSKCLTYEAIYDVWNLFSFYFLINISQRLHGISEHRFYHFHFLLCEPPRHKHFHHFPAFLNGFHNNDNMCLQETNYTFHTYYLMECSWYTHCTGEKMEGSVTSGPVPEVTQLEMMEPCLTAGLLTTLHYSL